MGARRETVTITITRGWWLAFRVSVVVNAPLALAPAFSYRAGYRNGQEDLRADQQCSEIAPDFPSTYAGGQSYIAWLKACLEVWPDVESPKLQPPGQDNRERRCRLFHPCPEPPK